MTAIPKRDEVPAWPYPPAVRLTRPGAGPDPGVRARLLAAHAVATRYYREQLTVEGAGPSRFLQRLGVPLDGPWVVGYAPDRPAGLVNQLRRHGFSDTEILASGLARTSRSGQLADRFRDRVMIGVRESGDSDAPVVAFAGYASPRVPADVEPILYSPGTGIYSPGSTLFGLAEQRERARGASVVANDPLEAIVISTRTRSSDAPPLVVSPAGPSLTPTHVAALTRAADTAAGVTVTVRLGDVGRRAAARAHALLEPVVRGGSGRPGPLRAARRLRDLLDTRPLADFARRGWLTPVPEPLARDTVGPAIATDAGGPEPSHMRESATSTELPSADRPASPEVRPVRKRPPVRVYQQLSFDLDFGPELARRDRAEHAVPDPPCKVLGHPNAPKAAPRKRRRAPAGVLALDDPVPPDSQGALAAPRAGQAAADAALATDGVRPPALEAFERARDEGRDGTGPSGAMKPDDAVDERALAADDAPSAASPPADAVEANGHQLPEEFARQGRNVLVRDPAAEREQSPDPTQSRTPAATAPTQTQEPPTILPATVGPAIATAAGGPEPSHMHESARSAEMRDVDRPDDPPRQVFERPDVRTAAPPDDRRAPAGVLALDDPVTAEAQVVLAADDAPSAASPPAEAVETNGHQLPDNAEPVEGVEGYHYARGVHGITVYGPDNSPVATGESDGLITVGDVEGVRIPGRGWGIGDFPVLAARQHRAVHLPESERDRVSVEVVPDSTARAGHVVVVHGTIKDNALDERATKGAAHFLWSSMKEARVSGRLWTPQKVDENFARLLTEFARQGRNVVVRSPAAEREQSPVPTQSRTRAATTPRQAQEPPTVLPAPDSMTDADLLDAFRSASARIGYGTRRDAAAAARAEALSSERQARVLRRVAEAPEVTSMSDADLAAEQGWLTGDFAKHAFAWNSEEDAPVKARGEIVDGEVLGRRARTLLTGPAPVELPDDALAEAYKETNRLWPRLRRERPEQDALKRRSKALEDEMASRQVRHYEQRVDVVGLSLDDLIAESSELMRPGESQVSYKQNVTRARETRLGAVDAEIYRREAVRFPSELARAEVGGTGAKRSVRIDGTSREYGHVTGLTVIGKDRPKFEAKVEAKFGSARIIGEFSSVPAAVAALVHDYDGNPETLPERTWGVAAEIVLPVGAHTELTKWLGPRSEATPELRRLAEILAESRSQRSHLNPLTRDTMHVYKYSVEIGLIDELARIAERVTVDLRERSADPQTPKRDQQAAKRRVPIMGLALNNIAAVREHAAADGIDTDRRAVDETAVAAQLAALADSAGAGSGGDYDSGQIQRDSEAALGAVPTEGTGPDQEPGGVLREEGARAGSGGDRSAGGTGGGAPTRNGLSGADRSAESDPGDGGATGDGGAAATAGGRGGSADAARHEESVRRFRPDPADVPRTPLARANANLEAIMVLRQLEQERRGAGDEETRVLARWSGWGLVPVLFLERPDKDNPAYGQGGEREGRYAGDLARWEQYSPVRDPLRELLDPFEWMAAARGTLSAYYTPQALAAAMWDGLQAFGFDGGEVLEAGSGAGAFFGVAPDRDTVRLTGVELDPTTAKISQLIYPHANVVIESFADTDAPAGTFDAAIGNVPFAHQVPFSDRRFGAGRHSLHNGFLIKELALTREGGLVIALTSRWTLDGEDEAARRRMAHYGDLLAAYRLPAGALGETTGTDVVADVLVFRRGADGELPEDRVWLHAPERELGGGIHRVNAYFDAHPEHVLGELTTEAGRFGPAVTVRGDPVRAIESLRAALRWTAELAKAEGRAYQPHPQGAERRPLNLQTAREKHANDYTGRLYVGEDGRIWQHVNGEDPAEAIPADGNTEQLRALIRMRDVAAELRELDRSDGDLARAEQLRTRLRDLYATYTDGYGPLSRPHQQRLGAGAEARERARAEARAVRDDERTPTAWGWFRQDPDAATVLALDSWDHQREAPVRSEVLTRRAGARRGELERTDDPKVALAAVVGATGRVDIERIAELLGTGPDEARQRLGREVFENPASGKLEHAGGYLSGAVRRKLDEARAAAVGDPGYGVNVAALEAVQPREKRIGQFTPQLGAHWIPPAVVQGFLRQYLGDPTVQILHNDRYGWSVEAGKVPDAINALKGTGRRSALQIARAVLGYGSLIVEDAVVQGERLVREVNEDASRAARQKADAMRSAFEEYVTSEGTRVRLVTDAYNRLMNGHVVRNYDGLSPTLAGFTDERTPHSHQLAGAARMQFERGVLLAHEVGLGKTTTLILGTQALKASGQINKPFAVVQRHLANQWLEEARFLYPNANIRLVTADELSGGERRRTLEWLRSNTPDLAIFTEGAFTSVKMSPEYQEWYEFREIDSVRAQILRERGVPDSALAVMKLERRLARMEARLRRNAAPMRTPGELYWDDLGFDYAAIDELHRFKGVGFRSKAGGGDAARIRGVDLHQKLTAMHRDADVVGGRPTVTGATGTPLTNSITEQYTMLALVAPWVLEEFGVAGPDLWADTFGQKVQRIEMAPDGSGLKLVERFSRFISKSTMKTMWGLAADTKSAADVGIKRPELAHGGPQLILVDPTRDQEARLKRLVARGAAIHAGAVPRDQDNMLAVANEGRAIACDPRLVDPAADPGPKLVAVADWFASHYHANKDRVYAVSTSDPTPHPVRGSLVIGFLNQGTPAGRNKGGFNAYAELRDLCVARGVPAEKIAFVQDHNHNPDDLTELYRKCRAGEVSIILASTDTMGTGANIQNRAVALAHIDLDWTPAGIEQRNGRILRWGNQNREVEIAIFATRGSMDSWQAGLLASKAEGLRDIQRLPEIADDSDTVEEIGAVEWDYATMQAEIGGNPYLGELMKARLHLAGLESDRRNHAADRLWQAELLERKTAEAAATRDAIARREPVLPLIESVRGDAFAIQIGEMAYAEHKRAGPALRQAVNRAVGDQRAVGLGPWRVLGQLGGVPFGVRPELTDQGKIQAHVGFPDLRRSEALYTLDDLTNKRIGGKMLSHLQKALESAPEQQALDRQRLPGLEHEIELLTQHRTAADFTERISRARRRVELLDDVVAAIAELDKVPELTAEDLDANRYPTAQQRRHAITKRARQRVPRQAIVDAAIDRFEAFDRQHDAAHGLVSELAQASKSERQTAVAGDVAPDFREADLGTERGTTAVERVLVGVGGGDSGLDFF